MGQLGHPFYLMLKKLKGKALGALPLGGGGRWGNRRKMGVRASWCPRTCGTCGTPCLDNFLASLSKFDTSKVTPEKGATCLVLRGGRQHRSACRRPLLPTCIAPGCTALTLGPAHGALIPAGTARRPAGLFGTVRAHARAGRGFRAFRAHACARPHLDSLRFVRTHARGRPVISQSRGVLSCSPAPVLSGHAQPVLSRPTADAPSAKQHGVARTCSTPAPLSATTSAKVRPDEPFV